RHPAPAAQGAGGRPNAAGGLRETGGPAIAGRAGADDRRAGTLAGAAHRTGPGRGAAARAAQLDAAAPTAPADPLLRSQRAIQVNVVATLGLARLKTSAKPPHSIPLPGPVAEVGLTIESRKASQGVCGLPPPPPSPSFRRDPGKHLQKPPQSHFQALW